MGQETAHGAGRGRGREFHYQPSLEARKMHARSRPWQESNNQPFIVAGRQGDKEAEGGKQVEQ